jgi:putative transposase
MYRKNKNPFQNEGKASHDRRRPIHFAVTSHPTAEWTAQQLLQALPWDTAPRFLLRDRDGNYGKTFRDAAQWLGIEEVLCAPRSPWQNAYAERLIGSIRRECLDHVIVLHESGLRRAAFLRLEITRVQYV